MTLEEYIKEIKEEQKIKEEMEAQKLKFLIKILTPKIGLDEESDVDKKYRYTYIASLKPLNTKSSAPKILFDEQNKLYLIILMNAKGTKRHLSYDIINLNTKKVFHGFPEANYQNTNYYKLIPQQWFSESSKKLEDIYDYELNWVLFTWHPNGRQIVTTRRSEFNAYAHLAHLLFLTPSAHKIQANFYLFKPSRYLIIQRYGYAFGEIKISSGSNTQVFLVEGTKITEILNEDKPLELEDVKSLLHYNLAC